MFNCQVTGDPMPVIMWRKKTGPMPTGRSQILDAKGLRIDRVVPQDADEYICEAKNPAGSIQASAQLIVHSPPTFAVEPKDETVEEGGSVSFTCRAQGNPTPTLFWSKEGEQNLWFPGTASVDGRKKVSTEGDLTIDGVQANDQAYYVCSALNAAGSNVARTYLKVKSRCKFEE